MSLIRANMQKPHFNIKRGQVMVKRFWFILVLCSLLIFSIACSRQKEEAVIESYVYALTISVEGEGTVDPSEDTYYYDEDNVVSLKASPSEGWLFQEWVGQVEDPKNQETAVLMDKDHEVIAVFKEELATATTGSPPPPPEDQAARSSWVITGEGYRAEADGWNCSGLQGEWNWRYTLDVLGYGTIEGDTSYIVPPPPESGPWLTEPFSYTLSGTLDFEDAQAEITYIFEDVVVEIIALDDGPVLMDNAQGMVRGIVKVVTPDISFVVSETYEPMKSDVPGVIVFERHPECD
jgi:hypothetical protein